MSQVPDILRRFSGIHRSGGGWSAHCSAHEDRKASLSLHEQDGKILVHCHAGCTFEAICRAVGIDTRDMFPDRNRKASRTARKVVARYDYVDEGGALLFQVLRYDPKGFSQRRPDGQNGWINNLDGTPRVWFAPMKEFDEALWLFEVAFKEARDLYRSHLQKPAQGVLESDWATNTRKEG